jgi:hypothetical protein
LAAVFFLAGAFLWAAFFFVSTFFLLTPNIPFENFGFGCRLFS